MPDRSSSTAASIPRPTSGRSCRPGTRTPPCSKEACNESHHRSQPVARGRRDRPHARRDRAPRLRRRVGRDAGRGRRRCARAAHRGRLARAPGRCAAAPDPAAARRAAGLPDRAAIGGPAARMLNEAHAAQAAAKPVPAAAGAFVVHKFGGSSLADAACFRRVADIALRLEEPRVALVLSACRGVTDALMNLVSAAERDHLEGCRTSLARLEARHREIADELLTAAAARAYAEQLHADVADLERLLQAVALLKSAGRDIRDRVSGFGELWSSRLFAAYLGERAPDLGVRWLGARDG